MQPFFKLLRDYFKLAYESSNQCNKVTVGNKTLFFITEIQQDFFSSLRSCMLLNMTLLTFDSLEDEVQIMEKINQKSDKSFKYFIGATDEGGMDNDYFWIESGKSIRFELDFNKGEPNNIVNPYDTLTKEDCLSIEYDSTFKQFGISDVFCSSQKNFICQKVVN